MRRFLIIAGHIIFWILSYSIVSRFFGIETIEVIEINDVSKEIITYDNHFLSASLFFFVTCIVVTYLNIYRLLPDYFEKKKLETYILKLSILVFVALCGNIVINRYIIYKLTSDSILVTYPSFSLHLILILAFLITSFAYAFTKEWYKNEQLKSQLQAEKLSTELSFLKSQINPHFLFNTLNNLYATAQKHNVKELETGIEELSGLMRYMLYESNASFVPLTKEIQQLESYIEIRKLSIGEEDDFILNFEKTGNFIGVSIAPLILLPFVENAFKHGISQTESSLISISIFSSKKEVKFKVTNKIFREERVKDKTAGIGLQNVRRRLSLIYPKNHNLTISEKDKSFTANLNIQFHG